MLKELHRGNKQQQLVRARDSGHGGLGGMRQQQRLPDLSHIEQATAVSDASAVG